MEPTNSDLLVVIEKQNSAFLAHAHQDEDVAEKQQAVNADQHKVNLSVEKSLAELHKWKETVATKQDVKEIFEEALRNFFKMTGLNAKTIILTTATIVGALVVIGGGAKAILGWLGFTMIGK